MVKGTSIQVRLTKNQKERILNMAESEGYPKGKISQFVRDAFLKPENNMSSLKLLREIHEEVINKKR